MNTALARSWTFVAAVACAAACSPKSPVEMILATEVRQPWMGAPTEASRCALNVHWDRAEDTKYIVTTAREIRQDSRYGRDDIFIFAIDSVSQDLLAFTRKAERCDYASISDALPNASKLYVTSASAVTAEEWDRVGLGMSNLTCGIGINALGGKEVLTEKTKQLARERHAGIFYWQVFDSKVTIRVYRNCNLPNELRQKKYDELFAG